jgi:hypothetical protein
MTDTGLSLSITPTFRYFQNLSSNNSTFAINKEQTSDSQGAGYVLYRGATSIYDYRIRVVMALLVTYLPGVTNSQAETIVGISYLDSPATTSATTYKMQARALMTTNSGSITTQNGSKPSSIILMEIGA